MDRNTFIEKVKGKLDELDNEFDQLQVKADKAGEDVRNDSNTRWEDVKDSVEKTWDSTLDGLKDIKNSLFK